MNCVANFLHILYKHFKCNCKSNQRLLILGSCTFLLFFVIITPHGNKEPREEIVNFDNTIVPPIMPITTVMPTKWWIKITATSTSGISVRLTPTKSPELLTNSCPEKLSSVLKTNIYAYISLNPPLPNRIHSAASLSSNFLGQIEPGKGLRLIDGPLCADGYSCWLVESDQSGLRGWTVEGNRSEQWILPCPNAAIPCHHTVAATSTPTIANNEKNRETQKNGCISDKFTDGMFVQVKQDSLSILRSEPYTGQVIGRAGPLSVAKVIAGPACAGNTLWWKLNVFDLGLTGWATEDGLNVCPKDSECNLEPR